MDSRHVLYMSYSFVLIRITTLLAQRMLDDAQPWCSSPNDLCSKGGRSKVQDRWVGCGVAALLRLVIWL